MISQELESAIEHIDWNTIAALGMLAMAFGSSVRKEVYRRQRGRCGVCDKHFDRLQIHHIVPHVMGGSDDEDNAVGLCPTDHRFADDMALHHHIFYPDIMDYPRPEDEDEEEDVEDLCSGSNL